MTQKNPIFLIQNDFFFTLELKIIIQSILKTLEPIPLNIIDKLIIL